MNRAGAKKEIARLRREIARHDRLYYVRNEPEISDREYDLLYQRLVALENEFPEYVTPDSPTRRVGGEPLKEFRTVEHRIRMLSLDNTYSEQEVRDFDERIRKTLGAPVIYETTLKVDGVAVSLAYEDGRLARGATRGDGVRGDDITQNLRTIRSIPLVIATDDRGLRDIEVRGEVYLPKRMFADLNREREKTGEPLFANPRNAAAGTLKLLDPRAVAGRGLDIFIHTVPRSPGKVHPSHHATLQKLRDAGFRTVEHARLCPDMGAVFDYINEWRERRHGLEYEVDGLVIKVDDFALRERLGYTTKSPRWAIAFKYPARQASTILREIQLQVGRTGRITPVAVLDPVTLSGSTIARATLHNEDEIDRRDIRIGDHVVIEKGGEVIPKVVGVLEAERTGREKKFRFPGKCPVCGQRIYRLPEEADWRCVNSSCPAQIKGKVLHFASRTAMDIQGLGDVLVDKLVNLGLVRGFDGLYRLEAQTLAGVERMGERSAANLIESIEKSKAQPFVNVLYALGIQHVGLNAARLLAENYSSIDDIMNASVEQLTDIPGIGGVIAESIGNYFSIRQNLDMVRNLRQAGLRFSSERGRTKAGKLLGKTFVFTGELSRLSRHKAQEMVRARGGRASSSVSKKTDYVVQGAGAGSKLKQAQKLGIRIITEDEFLKLVR